VRIATRHSYVCKSHYAVKRMHDFILCIHTCVYLNLCVLLRTVIVQEWVNFYLLGNDGGFTQTAKKVYTLLYMHYCTMYTK
jgi:hypothetical protein